MAKYFCKFCKAACFVLALLAAPLFGEEFVYKYRDGDRYRILSVVHEDVYVDRVLSHRAEILNRIAVEIGPTGKAGALHRADFQTAEKSSSVLGSLSYEWKRDYKSQFERDGFGHITISDAYFMPVVRNVPVFPGKDLAVGETWTADGHEAHDFRDTFGIPAPYRIPFIANYAYLGQKTWKGRDYPAFSVSYNIFYEPVPVKGKVWPTRIMGSSEEIVYWDMELGQPVAYTEDFRMIFELSSGRTIEFRGQAEAEIVDSPEMDKEDMVSEIEEEIARLGLKDVTVRQTDDGVAISLEGIQFDPESAVLNPSEIPKLEKISGILQRYKNRDILVGGHAARAGTRSHLLDLSQKRAKTVADYLISHGARTADRVVVRGFGADQPIADNSTEEGRIQNRRVEITILEN
jgi:outer membrane protein OmpA-like peptidoglycan-associated protein